MRLQKVFPRKVVRHRADTWNALMAMLAEWEQRKNQGGALSLSAAGEPAYVLVKNSSGEDVPQFGVLGIDNVVFMPTAAEAEFRSNPMVVGVLPDDDTHVGRFVVCIEPIAEGKFGKAVLSGLTVVKVSVSDESHGYADINDSDVSMLESGDRGAAQILWKESGTGTKWAVVRMGNPAPFEMVRFSGICMIDSENPTAKNPGTSTASSEGSTAEGQPGKPTDQQWLLMKFAGAPITAPWYSWNWHIPVIVSALGGTSGWFVYWAQLILNNFYVADDPEADPPQECATWATSPIDTTWGLGGNGISAKIPTSSWIFPDGQLLNIKWANSSLDGETAYGIALRPHSWWNWGDPPPQLSASIQVDHTTCKIIA